MINYISQKFDIIVIAGQSNAEGNGISTDNEVEVRNDVLQVVDANECYLTEDKKVFYTYPTKCKVETLQERLFDGVPHYDFSFSFVDEYIKNDLLEKDRKILLVKAAVGGSGFALNQQGVNNPLGKRTKDMVDFALSLNKDNRIVAYLWHQGEHDAWELAEINEQQRYKNYHDAFMEQTKDFLKTYSKYKFPVISGEFVREWSSTSEFNTRANTILRCLQDCMKELEYADFVTSENLTSNDQEIGNGDHIHFSKKALKELGKRYFQAFHKLINKNK